MTDSSAGIDSPGGVPAESRGMGHWALEALFAQLLAVLQSGPGDRIESVWSTAEQALLEHLENEEQTILADFLAARPREARAVLEEHAYLRRRLAQLKSKLPRIDAGDLRAFVDELRAHGRHEELVLYQWAEACRATTG